ncbi:MAG: autotransporter outer membrane beta-barrel domain-containing protein, partial [Chlorobiales bacterium]|nr:autotransporter outer membrane beta-barrel domain-containing protein [Chlorobiales bacterium]
ELGFVRGTFTTGDRDPSNPSSFTGEENGFDYDQYGLTVGIDRRSGNAVWGVALGYTNYEVEMEIVGQNTSGVNNVVDGGTIESDSFNGSIYFDHNSDNDVYISALAGFGNSSFDMVRNFIYFSNNTTVPDVVNQTRVLTAAPDADIFAGSITFGRFIQRGASVIDPRVGLTWDRMTIDRFAEVDGGNNGAGPSAMQLAFDEQKIRSFRLNVGLQFSHNFNTTFGSVRPTLSADWYYEIEDDPRVINAKYALEDDLAGMGSFRTGFDGCVSCFSLTSEAPDSNFYVVGAGIAAATQGGFQAFVMLEGLFGYSNLNAYAATIGLRGQF